MSTALQLVNGVPRTFSFAGLPTIYDQTYVATGSETAGTSITLPSSGNYQASELEVYFNGQRINVTDDYTYVGSGTRTQIQMTFDLLANDKIRFRVDRGA